MTNMVSMIVMTCGVMGAKIDVRYIKRALYHTVMNIPGNIHNTISKIKISKGINHDQFL